MLTKLGGDEPDVFYISLFLLFVTSFYGLVTGSLHTRFKLCFYSIFQFDGHLANIRNIPCCMVYLGKQTKMRVAQETLKIIVFFFSQICLTHGHKVFACVLKITDKPFL